MYFVFVTNDLEAVGVFEHVLHESGAKKNLVIIANGYDLIQFLQNVKMGEPYPDLIVLTPKFLRISGMTKLKLPALIKAYFFSYLTRAEKCS